MFEIKKNNLHFIISVIGTAVDVVPAKDLDQKLERIAASVAHNLQFLAQYVLCRTKQNQPLGVKNYFEQQGWEVTLQDGD